jgi:hypothetical protein
MSRAIPGAGGYALIDARCTHKDHDRDGRVYRAVGKCANCGSGPYLLLVTFGHGMPYDLLCPKCGCRRVRSDRLAEDDELPDSDPPAAVVAGRGAADGQTTDVFAWVN